ncbi:Teichuronic acid biosynthesis protein TuaB [Coriobacteriaceae bacterium CHKCI002]|nr:Teichuronic acid biosynthesis protein TuaB [Coriobacteriaceae bacterium CHKCI002]
MHSSLKQKTLSSLVWKFFERAGNQIIQLVVQVVLARLLAPDAFGMLAIMTVFINVGNVIVQSGLTTALVQSPQEESHPDDFSTVFWMSVLASAVMFGIVFVSAPAIASFYNMEAVVWPLRALSFVLVINAFSAVLVAKITRDLEFEKVFRATLYSVILSGVLGIAAAWVGVGVWALVIQQISYQAVNCVALASQVRWRPRLTFACGRARKLFSFGWRLLLSGLLETMYQSLSDLIIGKKFSADELGFVTQGKRYPQALGSLLDGAIQPVMLSAVAHVQDDVRQVKRLVRRALKTSTFLIVPAMTILMIVAEPLVKILLGEQWVPCVPFFQMYCFVYTLLPVHTTNLQALNGMGRSDIFLKLELIKKGYGLAILLFAAFVLESAYAIVAGYILAGLVSTLINTRPNKRVIGYSLKEQFCDIAPAFLLSAASFAVAWPIGLLGLGDVALLVLQAIVAGCCYLTLSCIFHVEALSYLVASVKEMVFGKDDGK